MEVPAVIVRWKRIGFALLILAAALVAMPDPLAAALTVAPAVLLLVLFTAGIRPGEALIERLRARLHPVRRPRAAAATRLRLPVIVRPVGLELASALAMRPPPSPPRVITTH